MGRIGWEELNLQKSFGWIKERVRGKMWKFILVSVGVCLFIFLRYQSVNVCDLTDLMLAYMAAVVALELSQSKRISEAQLIKDLNSEFINDDHLSLVEHKLEIYYSRYRHAKDEIDKKSLKLDLNLDTESVERQYLVNYLVHLEAIASLVNVKISGPLCIVSDKLCWDEKIKKRKWGISSCFIRRVLTAMRKACINF